MKIRGTEVQDFLRCRLKWQYTWIDGLKPKKPNSKLLFGSLFHKFLEVTYSQNSGIVGERAMMDLFYETDLSHMEAFEVSDISEMARKVAWNYREKYYLEDRLTWDVIATELTFEVPLTEDVVYTGTIDLIVRDRGDNKIYFLDHKTTTSIDMYDKNSDMDRQISRYWWALQKIQQGHGKIKVGDDFENVKSTMFYDGIKDLEIGGFVYNIILKDYPVSPRVLKSGALSKDKSQNTTYEMYVQEISTLGLDSNDYADILEHLKERPREYFRRLAVHRTQSEINAAIEEMYMTVQDMRSPLMYRNITKDCSWDCPFQPICASEISGGNTEYLKESLYLVEPIER